MSRLVGNWLQGYRTYTSEHESPDTFHFWTGLYVLASAIRRNVVLDQGTYLLYPNLYVILVAPPGTARKSSCMKLGKSLLHQIPGVKFGPDSVTTEKLISLIRGSYENNQSSMTIASSELSSLIMPSGISMIQFLTEVYECDYNNPLGWQYSTKGKGEDTLKNPCLNLFACTTPSWIAEDLPLVATEHGFTSRTVFVYEDKPRHLKPRPQSPHPTLVEALVNDLKHISMIEGTFEMDDEAEAWYDKAYREIRTTVPSDRRLATYYSRKDTHVLKVAMLMHLAESDDLVLNARDLDAALRLLEVTELQMPKTFSAMGKYEFASEMEHIYTQILDSGKQVTQAEVYDRFYHVGPGAVKEILSALSLMGRIRTEKEASGWVLRPEEGKTSALGSGGRSSVSSREAERGKLWDHIGADDTVQHFAKPGEPEQHHGT